MKNTLRIMLALVLIAMMIIPASAAKVTPQGLNTNATTLSINEMAPSTLDGKVTDGEYANKYSFKADTKGMVNTIKEGKDYGYVDIYLGYDKDYFYIGGVLQEDTYAVKKASGNYSFLGIHFGCNMKDDVNAAQAYIEATLAINENGSEFGGISVITYNETGTQKKDWGFMAKLNAKMKYARGTDANGKAITTYEIQIPFAVMKEAFGLDKIDDRAWFNFYTRQCENNGTVNGQYNWYNPLTEDQQADLMLEYDWSPKSLFNYVSFDGAKAPETTKAPDTTKAPEQTPATADNGIVYVALMMTAAIAVTLVLRRREND